MVSLAETQTLMSCPSHTALSLRRGQWVSGSWLPAPLGARSLLPKDNFMAAVTFCSDFGTPQNKVCHGFHCFPIYLL